MRIFVMRFGHRIGRDARISTHCGLIARAFGAEGIMYSGDRDKKMEKSIRAVSKQWGSLFDMEHVRSWKKTIMNWKKTGNICNLTVYGIPIMERIEKIRRKKKDLLVIVGGRKVPSEIYNLADWNISITNQPHSELGALSIFLHEYFMGRELTKKFPKASLKVVPQEHGKKTIKKQSFL